MADISLGGFTIPENVNPFNFLSATSISQFFVQLQFFIVFVVLGISVWYFRFYKGSWKDLIQIWDVTGSGVRLVQDKGKWFRDKSDGTGYYSLWRNKKARLKNLDQEHALITERGKIFFRVLKFGTGPFDYAQIKINFQALDNQIEELNLLPLSDIDWGKYQVKKEAEKKTLGKFWEEWKGPITLAGMFIFGLMTIMWIIGFANDYLVSVREESAVARESNERIISGQERIAQALERIITHQETQENVGEVTTPPI